VLKSQWQREEASADAEHNLENTTKFKGVEPVRGQTLTIDQRLFRRDEIRTPLPLREQICLAYCWINAYSL
jgi:hypothetical protein